MNATKNDKGKPRTDLLPAKACCYVWKYGQHSYVPIQDPHLSVFSLLEKHNKEDDVFLLSDAYVGFCEDYGIGVAESFVLVGDVLAIGEEKYGAHNWRNGLARSRLVGAMVRHAMQLDELDEESGKPHVHHTLCNILFQLEYVLNGLGVDDRFSYNEACSHDSPKTMSTND